MKKLSSYILIPLLMACTGFANAAQWSVTMNGIVTDNAGLDGTLNIGDALAFTVIIDDTNPDADPAAGAYLATDNSLVDTFLIVPVTGSASISTSGDSSWNSVGILDLTSVVAGLYLDYTVSVSGLGMTPDQIMPDFTTFSSGEILVDMSPLGAGLQVAATLNSIDITAIPAVPVPAAAWLFGSALIGLAGIKRRI